MSIANTLPKHLKPRREKVFGLARGSCLHDRNASLIPPLERGDLVRSKPEIARACHGVTG
jgi:hypothetical protein